MKIQDIKKAYLIGIKGAGMTAMAEILNGRGIHLTGSDTEEKFYTDEILKRNGIEFLEGFSAENVPSDADLVIYSTAYNVENNSEMAKASQLGIPMLSYSEMLGMLFGEKMGIAVCGTHGKTTTSAMLAQAFQGAGTDPAAVVGSQVIAWQGSALSGNGEYFIAEADEYQNKLKYYNPWSVILTSVDWDHPDFFPDFDVYKKTFKQFVQKIPKAGFLVVWGDSMDTIEVSKQAVCRVLTYGFGEDNAYKISNLKSQTPNESQGMIQSFEVFYEEESLGIFETPLSGKHNVLNASAVIALAHAMKLDLVKIRESLKEFKGTSRRFEYVGQFDGAVLIDDYAHHPDEIRATLGGARERFSGKTIWTVFHPHTFTRTKALLQEFAQSFDDADNAIVIDIYGSAREQQGGVSSEELVKLINKYNRGKAEYVPTVEETVEYLKEKSGKYDVLITMGAGDVWRVAQKLKNNQVTSNQ